MMDEVEGKATVLAPDPVVVTGDEAVTLSQFKVFVESIDSGGDMNLEWVRVQLQGTASGKAYTFHHDTGIKYNSETTNIFAYTVGGSTNPCIVALTSQFASQFTPDGVSIGGGRSSKGSWALELKFSKSIIQFDIENMDLQDTITLVYAIF